MHNKIKTNKQVVTEFLALTATFVFGCLFALEQIYNYDIWWHLKYGSWVLEHKKIPYLDFISFSSDGIPWVNTAWLSDVFLAYILQITSFDFLIILKACIIAVTFAFTCWWLIKNGINPYIAALIIGYVIVVARFRFLLRPLFFMFPFSIILFLLLDKHSENRKNRVFMLVPATLLWSNLHGSAYLSPIFCIFLLTEKLFQWLTTKMAGQNIKQFPLRELVLVLLVTATLLITPYGFAPVQLVFKRFIIQDIVIRSYSVQEHLPLAWGAHPMYTMLFITTAASFFLNWKNCRFFHILVFFGVSWLACSSVRYVGLAALIHAMLLGHNISQARDLFTRYRFIATTWLFHTTMPVILIAAAWFIFTSTFGPEKVYKFGLGINQKRFPGKAVQLLKDNNVSGNIFNSWQYGGYIQWFLPESKTFIDGRCLDEHLEIHEKLKSLSLQEQYSYLQKHDVIAAILARTDIQFSRLFEISPDYSLTYMDSQSMLYLRNDIKQKISATKNKKPFRFIQLQGFDISYLYPLAQGANKEEVESELRRAVSIFQENFHSFLQLAFFLDLQKKAESIDYYLKAAQLNPSLAFSHYNLGIQGGNAAIKYKQWEKGQKILSLAIKHNNKDPQMFFMLGIVHYEQGNYLEAARFYNKSLSIAPNNVTTLINLGYTYLDAGEYQNSLINFKKAYALSPDSEGALYGIALALEKSGKPDSTTTWKEFLSKFPDSKWAGQAKRYLDKH